MFKQFTNKSALDDRKSRYVIGGTTDTFSNRLGWWQRDNTILQRAIDDITFLVDAQTERNANLISQLVYNTTKYEWLVLQYNNIVDINEELIIGRYIVLPSVNRTLYQLSIK